MTCPRHSALALAVSLAFTALAHGDYIAPSREILPAPAYDAADPVAAKIKVDPNYVPPKVGVGHVTLIRREIGPRTPDGTGGFTFSPVKFSLEADIVLDSLNPAATGRWKAPELDAHMRWTAPGNDGTSGAELSFDTVTLVPAVQPSPTEPPLPNVLLRQGTPISNPNGQTQVTDLGNGTFHFNSFFDVFFDISLDNGATWTPADLPHHLDALPEPSSLAIALPAVVLLRRRSR